MNRRWPLSVYWAIVAWKAQKKINGKKISSFFRLPRIETNKKIFKSLPARLIGWKSENERHVIWTFVCC